jgi:hypothetical protein
LPRGGFTLAEIRRYAQQAIALGSQVASDGLACFRAFDAPTYVHECHITGGGRDSVVRINHTKVFVEQNTSMSHIYNVDVKPF